MTEGSETPEARDRLYFPELDGLRFVAFFLVFVFHQGIPWGTLAGLVGQPAARALRENGWVGVQLFFVLSGYLITTLLLREEATFGRVDLRAFWVRRILRIWPLYYLTVLVTFVLMPLIDGGLATSAGRSGAWRHLPYFLTFLGNWSMIAIGPVDSDAKSVLWSVCVEEQFYLFVPLIVAGVGRRFRIPLVLALIASAVVVRALLARFGVNQLTIQYSTFAQADTLLSGVFLALWLGPDPRSSRVGRWLAWGQWGVFAFAVWVVSWPRLAHDTPWKQTFDFVPVWAAGAAVVAVAVTVPGRFRRALAYPRLVRLGTISYGLYMFHEVGFWLREKLSYALGWFPNQDLLLAIAALAMTIGLATASYEKVERPFLRLKRGWTRVPSRPV